MRWATVAPLAILARPGQAWQPITQIAARRQIQQIHSTEVDAVESARRTWYPTKIQQVTSSDDVIAVRVSHALFATEELAASCFEELKQGSNFRDLARSVSACGETREAGGEVGWVGLNDDYLDLLLPREVREQALALKAGDMALATSSLGCHIVQIDDIMTKVKVKTVARPGERRLKGKGLELPSLAEQLSGGAKGKPSYFVETLGCQMNFADTERMAGQLEDLGMEACAPGDEQNANVVILNTCSIRDKAEQKVYSYLGPHVMRKRRGDPVAIVVAGCVAQQEGEALLRRVPEIDLVMGPQYANRIGDLLEDVMNGNQLVATDPLHIMEDMTKPKRGSTTTAWVNIIYGCNEHCTYCVVPGTRGVEQSRPKEAVVAEVEALVKEGFKEVTLLGQNVDAWGRDMAPKQLFADLLAAVSQVPGIARVRFVTSHPRYMSPRVVTAVAENPTACQVFHIPFQSGNDEVLKRMGRGYTREKYLSIVQRIRDEFGDGPAVSITADLIVGFPGETEEQFQETLSLLEEVKFDACMTAAYSPRPNTEAADWPDQIDEAVKQARLTQAKRLVDLHAAERSAAFAGRVEEVLVERRNLKNPLEVMGRTRSNRQVFFQGDIDALKGALVHVRIDDCQPFYLSGEMVESPAV